MTWTDLTEVELSAATWIWTPLTEGEFFRFQQSNPPKDGLLSVAQWDGSHVHLEVKPIRAGREAQVMFLPIPRPMANQRRVGLRMEGEPIRNWRIAIARFDLNGQPLQASRLEDVQSTITTITDRLAALESATDLVSSLLDDLEQGQGTINNRLQTVEGALADLATGQAAIAQDIAELSAGGTGGGALPPDLVQLLTALQAGISQLLSANTLTQQKLDQIIATVTTPSTSILPGQYSVTQSSIYTNLATLAGTYTNLNDRNGGTGAATNNNTAGEWIRVDFNNPVRVAIVTVGAGSLPTWGNVSPNLQNAWIEYSNDATAWTRARQVPTGVLSDGGGGSNQFLDLPLPTPITARYWRLWQPGWLATTEFSFR